MILQPTMRMPGERTGRTYLTISVRLPDGHIPVSSFRGMNVGVGGKHTYCTIAPGEPVRRATLNELRRRDRNTIARLLTQYPDGELLVGRSWH